MAAKPPKPAKKPTKPKYIPIEKRTSSSTFPVPKPMEPRRNGVRFPDTTAVMR